MVVAAVSVSVLVGSVQANPVRWPPLPLSRAGSQCALIPLVWLAARDGIRLG